NVSSRMSREYTASAGSCPSGKPNSISRSHVEDSRNAFRGKHHVSSIGGKHCVKIAVPANRFRMRHLDKTAAHEFDVEFLRRAATAERSVRAVELLGRHATASGFMNRIERTSLNEKFTNPPSVPK